MNKGNIILQLDSFIHPFSKSKNSSVDIKKFQKSSHTRWKQHWLIKQSCTLPDDCGTCSQHGKILRTQKFQVHFSMVLHTGEILVELIGFVSPQAEQNDYWFLPYVPCVGNFVGTSPWERTKVKVKNEEVPDQLNSSYQNILVVSSSAHMSNIVVKADLHNKHLA